MHHKIVVKVWAGEEGEAENIARDAMEESIEANLNTAGWDCFDSAKLIEKKDLQPNYGVNSFEELEKKKIAQRHENIKGLSEGINVDIKPLLAPYFLTKEEASLHINTEDDNLKKCVEKILKRKKDITPPDSFEKIVDTFTDLIVSIAKKDTGHSMLMYDMEVIKKLQYCIDDPSPNNTLQCTDNHYAELPCDYKKGLKPFYFSCDRHF